jgi:prepilin-type N-terminal cleavage/methylation domain-containing protein
MIDKPKQSGFSAVELLITLFIAAVFLMSGFELYAAIIKNGADARRLASASSVMSDYIQRYKSTATNPCTVQTPLTNSSITVSGLSNVTITIAINCPYNSGSYTPETTPQTVSEIVATVKYGTPQQTVSNATFVSNQNSGIVTSGLVLDLDAGNAASYPGSGATWTDLSTSGNNAALTGTVTFSNDGGGSIGFDGATEYGTITNNGTLNFASGQTVIMVLKHSYSSGRTNPWNQAYGGYGTWTHENGSYITQFYGNAGADAQPYDSNPSPTTPKNVWNFMASTRNTSTLAWYLNGVQGSTKANLYGTLAATAANILIAKGYVGYWPGSISVVLAYTRALTPSEINQDFNALRSRYAL